MNTFKITYWTGTTEIVTADSAQAAFEATFGGPVTETGYNENRVWLDDSCDVFNDTGDRCATIELTES